MIVVDMERIMNVLHAFKNGSVVLLEVRTSFVRLVHVFLEHNMKKWFR